MFEYYGNIHVYCPGVGADEPLGTYVDLAVKKGQGHQRVMIYMHIVVLQPSMLHAKFL